MSVDLSKTVEVKSDQLNSDDLLTGPITIRITKVTEGDKEQPVAIHYEGDNGKPYKPSKGMRRVIGQAWGWKADPYPGRSMTLYRDGAVKFGKDEVGGIRISHMSHLESDKTFAVTLTRGKKVMYTVTRLATEPKAAQQATKPAQTAATPPEASLEDREKAFRQRITDATTQIKLKSLWAASAQLRTDIHEADEQRGVALEKFWTDRHNELEPEVGG